ncbi:MAG: nicotinate phosphoribosyltransferase [Saprospiraceae bacterium]|nr:MAG: nicotinate phosphoribosyltransferase [Saprospiraceae bacterium]
MNASHLRHLVPQSLGLFTDLYQLTMAYAYWQSGLYNREAVFHHFFRSTPFKHPYAISAGLALAVEYLQAFRFSTQDIQYLGGLRGADNRPLFDESFLNYLQRMDFSCNIDAVPEGTVVFPHQPLVRVQGPLLQAQLIETALLNLINFSTLIATKSARIVQAAEGDEVLDFGLRRAQGIDGGMTASRSAYIGGCHATSNAMAGRILGIPVKGTHAHSWVMCFEDELTAFRTYARQLPNNCVFLVDTYDTIEGVKNAIIVGHELRKRGHEMLGIRLDSGDLATLSIAARELLDQAGFPNAAIVASNNLDEYKIAKLKKQGAKINIWGVGTRLVTGYDQPALGGVYKLAALRNLAGNWDYKIKLSEQAIKVSNPGVLQIRRYFDSMDTPIGDMIYNTVNGTTEHTFSDLQTTKVFNFEEKKSKDLLVPIFRNGKLIYQSPDLTAIRDYCLQQQSLFQDVQAPYPTGLEKKLQKRKSNLIAVHELN